MGRRVDASVLISSVELTRVRTSIEPRNGKKKIKNKETERELMNCFQIPQDSSKYYLRIYIIKYLSRLGINSLNIKNKLKR